jgi:hypothetical protein
VSFFKRTPTIVPDLPPEGSGYLATLKAVKGGYLCTFATEQSPVAKVQRDDVPTSLIYKTAFLFNQKTGSLM